jgi:hypothetical protein
MIPIQKLRKTTLLALALIGTIALPVAYAPYAAAETAIECTVLPDSICENAKNGDLENSGIWLLLEYTINFLSVGVGIVAVAMIGYAGFLYATAQDGADQTKKAKDMIFNVSLGIVGYALMYAGVQWLIPGGVF